MSAQSPWVSTLLRTARTDARHIFSVENGVIGVGAAGVAVAILPREKYIVRLATVSDGMDDAFNLVVGAAIGLVAGRAVVHVPRAGGAVTASPLVSAEGAGFTLTWTSKY